MTAAVVIGFRDRGTDPLRRANLNHVLRYLDGLNLGTVHVASDGRNGTSQFNRHAAYNTGAQAAFTRGADTIVFYESDMLVPAEQLRHAITAATDKPGLVVPFTARHELGPADSDQVRAGADHTNLTGALIMPKPRRTGAVNVISRTTYTLVGRYDPTFTGSHWDDRAMHRAFDLCAGPTRWIDGPSWHLYHLPGYQGPHLTDEDRAATAANRRRYGQYKRAHTPDQIRALTRGHA